MITTDRLILDRHRADDLENIRVLWSDPLVVANISRTPCSATEARARLLRYAGQWALDGWGFFAVRDRLSGAFIGEVGFLNVFRDIEPRMDDRPEMGWVMGPAGRGNGMAREALEAALDWADRNISHDSVHCIILPDNAPSLRLAHSTGFRPSHRATGSAGTFDVLVRARD